MQNIQLGIIEEYRNIYQENFTHLFNLYENDKSTIMQIMLGVFHNGHCDVEILPEIIPSIVNFVSASR